MLNVLFLEILILLMVAILKIVHIVNFVLTCLHADSDSVGIHEQNVTNQGLSLGRGCTLYVVS